jgi:hypothetical protein
METVSFDLSQWARTERWFRLMMYAAGLVELCYSVVLLSNLVHVMFVAPEGGVTRLSDLLALVIVWLLIAGTLFLGAIVSADGAITLTLDDAGFKLSYANGKGREYAWQNLHRPIVIWDYRGLQSPFGKYIGSGIRFWTRYGSRTYLTPEAFDALIQQAKLHNAAIAISEDRRYQAEVYRISDLP